METAGRLFAGLLEVGLGQGRGAVGGWPGEKSARRRQSTFATIVLSLSADVSGLCWPAQAIGVRRQAISATDTLHKRVKAFFDFSPGLHFSVHPVRGHRNSRSE
jgi:hypothetical protein